MALSDAHIERYSRQIILPAIGGRGQQRLLETSIAVIGEGALARTAALYLTAAGVGALDLCATPRATSHDELHALNPDTSITLYALDAVPPSADVMICADVPPAILQQTNRIALHRHVTLIAGVAGRHAGLAVYVGRTGELPCAACDPETLAHTSSPGSEASAGVIGSLLALEGIKASLDLLDARAVGRGLRYDPSSLTFTERPISKRSDCLACAPVRHD